MLTLIVIVAFLANFAIGITVYVKNPRGNINRLFLLVTISLLMWAGSNYMADQNYAPLLWNRLTFLGAAAIAGSFFVLSQVFPKGSLNQWSIVQLVAFLGMSIVTLGPGVVSDVTSRPETEFASAGFDPVYGPLYGLFAIYFLFSMAASLYRLLHRYMHLKGFPKNQIKFYLAGVVGATISGVATNLLIPLLTGTSLISSMGILSALIFSSFTGYAIIKHRLMDIRAIVARSVAYVLLLGAFSAIYGAGLFIASNYLFINSKVGSLQLAYYATTALLLAFSFQSLQRFFERITDKLLYRDRYDSQEVLNQLGTVLVSEFKLESLLTRTLKETCEALNINNGQFYVFNQGKIYKVEHYGPLPEKLITVPHLRSLRRNFLIADELEGGREKALMDEFGFRLAIKLHTKNEFVGFLFLGDKLNGDIYSTQDIKLLQILSQELAVAISNAKAVEEIAEFNITLQEKVDSATKRLRAANRHLKELDVAKDEFISMASHQLRTPLTTIKGYLSMLSDGDAGKLTKQQTQFLNRAYSGSQRMVDLINDLLSVSRLQAGKFNIVKEPCDFVQLVGEEVEQLHNHAVAKNLELKFNRPKAKWPRVSVDAGKTRQVIMNFIDNAIYYTQVGSVTVSLERIDNFAQLTVTDTGIGVPLAAQKHLFGKFYRASNAMNVRPDGTGLGLFLAKRVIEDQGGNIIFKSQEGKGSTFGFRLPMSTTTSKAVRRIPIKV